MPMAPPICCEVLISPDASPASAASTPASAAIEMGTKENPIPTPIEQEAGKQVTHVGTVGGHLREVHEASGERRHPDHHDRLHPDRG